MKKNLLWIVPVALFVLSGLALLLIGHKADYIANGNKLVDKNQYIAAIEQYQKALELDPKNIKAARLISLCYIQSGDMDQGLSYALLASKNAPSYTSYYNLGLIYSIRREFDKALKAFDQALILSPKNFNAEYQKGLIYADLKKYDEAINFYQKALALNPSSEKVRLSLFSALLNQGDLIAARAQIEEFRKMNRAATVEALENRIHEANPAA